jgi:hypothetical protein
MSNHLVVGKRASAAALACPEDVLPPPSGLIEGASMVAGGVAGAAVGAIAGPPGAIAGALVGLAVGALAGGTLHNEVDAKNAHDEELDKVIGVSGGHLGEASTRAPNPRVGAFSASSMGAAGEDPSIDNEGPIAAPEPE